ncbi:MAG TPA: endonuclease/exonuclease/phosphatase family protein [Candidatus Paceibacterota bacterium]|nr:endonuclease/exonuclease/phosphatase family protein [Candidatus Paceibacterota bacterium]
MKLISLNTWAGRGGNRELLDFFARNKGTTDIFCLQEIWEGGHEKKDMWGPNVDSLLYTHLKEVLDGYNSFFYPHFFGFFGLAIFVKKEINILEEGEEFVFKGRENMFDNIDAKNGARNLEYVKIDTPAGIRVIVNFHGLWNGISKEDTEDRFRQAENLRRFLDGLTDPHVLCGDFNLLPNSESLKLIQGSNMRNLIKEFGITSTRSSFYKKDQRFADYTLVSEGITVNEFKILPDEVSDHLAMYLDFE